MLNDKQRLGNMILKLRLDYKLTQEELGEKIGVNRQTLSAYERGERSPNIEQLIVLSKEFGVSTDYLLGIRETNEFDEVEFVERYTGLHPKSIEVLHEKQTKKLQLESELQTKKETANIERLTLLKLYFWYIDHLLIENIIDSKLLNTLYTDLNNMTQSFERVESKFKDLIQSDFSKYEIVKSDIEALKNKCEEKHKEYMRTVCFLGERLLTIERIKTVKSYREIISLSERMLAEIEVESNERIAQIRKYRKWPSDNPPYWKKQKYGFVR